MGLTDESYILDGVGTILDLEIKSVASVDFMRSSGRGNSNCRKVLLLSIIQYVRTLRDYTPKSRADAQVKSP